MDWKPRDYIAILVAAACLVLIGLGINGRVGTALMLVLTFYYGQNYIERKLGN